MTWIRVQVQTEEKADLSSTLQPLSLYELVELVGRVLARFAVAGGVRLGRHLIRGGGGRVPSTVLRNGSDENAER